MKRSSWIFPLFILTGLSVTVSSCARLHSAQVEPIPEKHETLKKISSAIKENEKMQFSIRWLGLEVGRAEVIVKGVEKIRERDAYHIVVYVRSNSLIDIVYPVRDEHHSYIDAERFHSLRYEKILKEGRYRADEFMEYDQDKHVATYHSRRSGDTKEMLIPKDVQDQLSCGFWFRKQSMKPGETLQVAVNADEKNWDFEVNILGYDQVVLENLGTFNAIKMQPLMKFQGIFVRRGQIVGWMSADEKRLPLMMKTKIPVLGTVTAVLVNYERD